MAVKTAGLIAFWLVLSAAYVGTCAVMSLVVARQRAPLELARSFAFTLVPIAIGYHVAHYLTFLLVQGQYIIPLISDPFGYGWNLFGTAGYRVDIALVGARFAWYAALAAVLTGHIAAVYLAHRKAMRAVRGPRPRVALAGAADRADGGLHRRQPLDPGRAGGRAARAGAARVGQRRGGGSRRRGAARARQRPPARGRAGQGRAGEADLSRARLGVSRRQQDDDCRSPLCHHVRLSLGRSRRERALRSRHRRRDRADAPAPRRVARGRDRCRLEELPRGRCQLHARALHHRGLCGGRARRSGAGRDRAAAVERAALACARADGGSGVARLRGVLAGRSAAPRRRMARSGPRGADEREACRAGRDVRARRLPAGSVAARW